jgi:hypothetical protein
MKDIHEVLRLKELEISRLEIEVEALRIAAPLLSDDEEFGNDNKPTSTRRSTASQSTQVPQAVNAFPQPDHAPEWKAKGQRWP